MEIDHLAVTCASLPEGVAWTEARLGLTLAPGGRHERFGTWNRLLSLGPGLRAAWTDAELASRFPDVVAWRDGLYRAHRAPRVH